MLVITGPSGLYGMVLLNEPPRVSRYKLALGVTLLTTTVTRFEYQVMMVAGGQSHKVTPPGTFPKLLPLMLTVIPGPMLQGLLPTL
jgi:hypothetical protein